jgi:hypothetical protein
MGFGDSLKAAFGFKKKEVVYPMLPMLPMPPEQIMLTPPVPARAVRRPMTAAERVRWGHMNETLGERLKRESEKRSKYAKTLPIG